MKFSIHSLALLSVFALTSCTTEQPEAPANTTEQPVMEFVQPAADVVPAAQGEMALNPHHGEPGHICEIPVGAPLNSVQNAQPAPTQPVITTTPAVAPPTIMPTAVTGKRINPPHGEEGHVCEVPVGAPLP
jgi:hypothetical protein